MEIIESRPFPDDVTSNDDETSSANTEDALISARNSSETINSTTNRNNIGCCVTDEKKITFCGTKRYLISGIILIIIGIVSLIWTPFEVLMNERLKMMPGFPPYEWWKNPPDEVLLRVYIFNVTNSEEFLSGTDVKLKLQEVGPIIYREKLTHSNISFNENGTLSYVATRTAIFLPEMNTINLNETLIMPNLALLGMASYLYDASLFTKVAFNLMVRSLNSQALVKTTISDYLWNFTDPLLDAAQRILPSLVPVKNMGILHRIYSNFEDLVTVFVGAEHGHERFFMIDKYHGSQFVPFYDNHCQDLIVNSTEGVAYAQFLTKNSTLLYWRKTLCKVTPLYYESESIKFGLNAYKFELPNNTFDRKYPAYSDCYLGDPPLPSGLSDVSKCYYDFPMAASFPHFLYGDDILQTYVDGLSPNYEKHHSFVYVEPTTGIPMESRARSQSNLIMREFTGFNSAVQRFSNVVVPMFWAEYNQVGLPWYIYCLMYFTVVVLPTLQKIISGCCFLTGTLFVALGVKRIKSRRSYVRYNKSLQFEKGNYFSEKL
ncbi:scavenger receptor class B member 1 [Agrilus planipennis]|uniref:Scavenger receptor class B member 1 n=1 Tax=Agrilus planipennis TaxID=224129 RepID=A0A1W4WNH6_AGRPL|nr:scavenger receptor class B member 1 [Agrilus planipennis]